jgi:hypothetical protein
MSFKKSVLNTAVISALGMVASTAALMPSTASAVAIADGAYLAIVNTTPTITAGTPSSPTTAYKFGKDGAWTSSFTFGLNAPQTGSQGQTDNNNSIVVTNPSSSSDSVGTPAGTRGSSALGNGAGSFIISLAGGSFSIANFQMDAIDNTAGGTFVEYGTMTGGTTTGTGGMTLDPTGRLGAVGGAFPSPGALHDERWNVPSGTAYRQFTTGASSNTATGVNTGTQFINSGAITGHEAVTIGDINSDGKMDYNIILVSASSVGADWGGFNGAQYIEVWNMNLVSTVPIPAAAWLLGSGLMGLAAVARRKKKDTA